MAVLDVSVITPTEVPFPEQAAFYYSFQPYLHKSSSGKCLVKQSLNPINWGWKKDDGYSVPIGTN